MEFRITRNISYNITVTTGKARGYGRLLRETDGVREVPDRQQGGAERQGQILRQLGGQIPSRDKLPC